MPIDPVIGRRIVRIVYADMVADKQLKSPYFFEVK
jgi:hypothetical protein